MENNTKGSNLVRVEEEGVSMQELFELFLSKWKWFVLSLVVCVVVAALYLMSTAPIYTRTAQLQIKDQDMGKSGAIMDQMMDMGFMSNKSDINNELIAIKSPTLMSQVILDLRLNDKYVAKKGLRKIDLYKNTPIFVVWQTPTYNENINFDIHIDYKNNKVALSNFTLNGDDFGDEQIEVILGDTVSTPVGSLSVISSGIVDEEWIIEDLKYSRYHIESITDAYCKKFNATLADKKASIIDLTVEDASEIKAVDIINTLIARYNQNWVDDKNKVAESTSKFINQRLEIIKDELSSIDNSIANFKGNNLLPDIKEVSKLYLEQSSQNVKQILSLQSQLSTVEYMQEVLSKQDFDTPLPSSSALTNATLSRQVENYNSNLLERNKLLSNSSESNPLVVDLTKTLKAMQVAILQSVSNEITSLNMQINTLKQQENQNIGKIAKSPTHAKYLQTEERQQKVMEGLYLFLLQKREENELSKAFTAYNSRVITEPRGSLNPTSPKKLQVLLIAIVLGLLIPAGILYLMQTMDNKVRSRKDLENLKIPFAGEIPQFNNTKQKEEDKDKVRLVVREGVRNIVNEAFRVVRTNVDFMIKHVGKQVIMTTSLNPDSGKSFITANLGCCMALKKKRVVAIDLDLRVASLSQIVNSPKRGIVDYLNGDEKDWKNLLVKVEGQSSYDVIPVGTIPPNPSELLLNSDNLKNLLTELRKEYDYVFIDCPPVDIVADAGIVATYADMTLFVIRAGRFEKAYLHIIDDIYESRKYPSMSLILNYTALTGKYGSKYGYGYGYGKSYGKYVSDED